MNILEPEDKPKGLNYSVVSSKHQVNIVGPAQVRSIYLSLDTATRPRGHSRQVSAASVSIRQLKDQIIGRS